MSVIYAWTAPGVDYPAFLNVSDADVDGEPSIRITVRGPKQGDRAGPTADVVLPVMAHARLVGFLKHHFNTTFT